MDVIAGLGLMFGAVSTGENEGNDSSGTVEVKYLIVPKVPTTVYYYDTVEEVSAVSDYNVPYVIREVYADGVEKYYQLVLSEIDTENENVVGIRDLSTDEVITIRNEV